MSLIEPILYHFREVICYTKERLDVMFKILGLKLKYPHDSPTRIQRYVCIVGAQGDGKSAFFIELFNEMFGKHNVKLINRLCEVTTASIEAVASIACKMVAIPDDAF